jgi:hypothetical protein
MAGAGYKLFNTGDVLTAAQVNTYLMEQSVMVFADAAARTTALTGVVAEGMLSYLKDTNAVEVYNGSAWVASDDPNAIQNTIVDAKGDLIAASAADTPARLAVGNNGETLVADSSTSTGLRYNPQNALANPVINGGFDIWQRGTSISLAASAGTTFLADRWCTSTGANQACTISRQATGDTTNLPNIQYALRFQRNSGQTGTGGISLSSSLETVNTIPFAGKTVTMSFYARKGANYAPGTFNAYLITGTGTDQNRQNGGYTGESSSITSSPTLTTSWQRFVITGTLGASTTEMAVFFFFDFSGTAGAADYFEITGFQVDLGTYTASTAPSFRRSGGTIQGELAACQRYYQRFSQTVLTGNFFQDSGAKSTTKVGFAFPSYVPFRALPSALETTNVGVYQYSNATQYTSGTWAYLGYGPNNQTLIDYTHGSAVFTANNVCALVTTSAGSLGFIGLSAEL